MFIRIVTTCDEPSRHHRGSLKTKKPFDKDDVVQLPVYHQRRLDWVNCVVFSFVKPVKFPSEYVYVHVPSGPQRSLHPVSCI